VWNLEYRQFFIDSLVRNYPTQSIFLEIEVDPDIPTVYRVLDGKQRLSSLIKFTEDEFPAPDSLADLKLSSLYYSDFPKDFKKQILSYLFTIEVVEDATSAELNQAFDRLNRNVARLNRQELRHAQFGGAFLSKMERLADNAFWSELGLVTPARRRRMLDVEYVSELYVIGLKGIQDGKDYLDEIYAAYDQEIVGEEQADRTFRRTREFLEFVHNSRNLSATRFTNVADFYSLWAAVSRLLPSKQIRLQARRVADALASFQEELENQESSRSRDYLLAARQGSNKASNRTLRAEILEQVLREA